jgi:hypothetical protein
MGVENLTNLPQATYPPRKLFILPSYVMKEPLANKLFLTPISPFQKGELVDLASI